MKRHPAQRCKTATRGRSPVIGGFSLIAIIAFLLAVCLPHEPSLAKKPPNDDPPEPPPVVYLLDFFEPPPGGLGGIHVHNMNAAGCVVGWYFNPVTEGHHGFVYDFATDYDPEAGIGQARDLTNEVGDMGDWRIQAALGINDPDPDSGRLFGDIVGYVVDEVTGEQKACFIDMNATDPTLEVIDLDEKDFGTLILSRAGRINSSGDIVGTFQREDGTWGGFLYNPGIYEGVIGYDPEPLNISSQTHPYAINDRCINEGLENVFQIAGEYYVGDPYERYPFRWDIEIFNGDPIPKTPLTSLDLPKRQMLDHHRVSDISNAEVVLGYAVITVGKGNKTEWACYRHDGRENPAPEWLYLISPDKYEVGSPESINDQGDCVTNYRVFFDAPLNDPDGDPLGFFFPYELIDVANDPNDAAIFVSGNSFYGPNISAREINNRTTDAYGQIAGDVLIDENFKDGPFRGIRIGFVLHSPHPPPPPTN